MSAQDLEQRAREYQQVLDMLGVATHEEAGAEIGRLHAAALRQQPAPVDLEQVGRTDRELLTEFIRICREHKPVGQWPGERLCAAIERVMQNEKPFRFIAEADMAPERGHNGRGGDADRPFSGPRCAAPHQPAKVAADLTPDAMKIGFRYNWKNQQDRLVYLGRNGGGNGQWHQFELVDQPGRVWCELLDSDLRMLEETQPAPVVDDELPGMWSQSDFMGGAADAADDARQLVPSVDDAMVDRYLAAQAKAVQEIDDAWGNGGKAASYLHPVREACRAGLTAAAAVAGNWIAADDRELNAGRLKALHRGLELARKWSAGTGTHGHTDRMVRDMADELRSALSSQDGDYAHQPAPVVDDAVVSALQSTRDRMMAALTPKFGDAFDGDFDVMLEAINTLKRLRTSTPPAPVVDDALLRWVKAQADDRSTIQQWFKEYHAKLSRSHGHSYEAFKGDYLMFFIGGAEAALTAALAQGVQS